MNLQIQEAYTQQHSHVVKVKKMKREDLKGRREKGKSLTKKPQSVRMIDSSLATVEVRRGRRDIFNVIRENCQPRILYPEKLPFKNYGKIKTLQIN